MPLRETWESVEIKDGKTGSPEAKPHGSPGRKKEIREIKKSPSGNPHGVSRKNREEEQKIRG